MECLQPRAAKNPVGVRRRKLRPAVVGQSEQGERTQVLRARVGAEIVVKDDEPLARGHQREEPLELVAELGVGGIL